MNDENYKYSSSDVDNVNAIDIRTLIDGCNERKASQQVTCPKCGKKKLSVIYKKSEKKNFAYCHACGLSFPGSLAVVAYELGLDLNRNFLEVLEETARRGGVILLPQERHPEQAVKKAVVANKSSFLRKQLEGSGLTEEDVVAKVWEGGHELFISPFRKGRLTEAFIPDLNGGDEMLLYYYDLNGQPMTYTPKGASRPRPYVRVRWSNPAIHKSSDGKEMKYQTPPGASCRVWIPEKIRRLYKTKTHIDTLFIQEGEKKSEKACKHGMLSIGIQGIQNFGSQDEGLLQDIQDLARVCTISNIVLIMDSDWNDLHREITIGES